MNLEQTITILSAMITPIILIMASGSLILTTSQRLSRVIERTRKLSGELKEFVKENNAGENKKYWEEESKVLFTKLNMATQRARILQRAMTSLYLTISLFLATSISIAVVDITHSQYAWIPIALGIIGSTLLFYASIILIKESRIAVMAVDHEMEQAILLFQRNLPGIPKDVKKKWLNSLLKNIKIKVRENKNA